MAGRQNTSNIAAYKSVAAQGTVHEADPYQIICLLMDGALERLAAARNCIEQGNKVLKASLLHRVVTIIQELSASLNVSVGGEMAENLAALYDYMGRRILVANLEDSTAAIDEVVSLLQEVRQAWGAIPLEVRTQKQAVP